MRSWVPLRDISFQSAKRRGGIQGERTRGARLGLSRCNSLQGPNLQVLPKGGIGRE